VDSIKLLLLRYLRDDLQAGDQAMLDEWLAAAQGNRALLEELEDSVRVGELLVRMEAWDEGAAWQQVEAYLTSRKTADQPARLSGKHRSMQRLLVAASLAAVIAGSGYLFFNHWAAIGTVSTGVQTKPAVNDAPPGRDQAVLTLSGGKQIILDSTAQDTVLTEGAATVAGAKGKLAYSGNGHPSNHPDAAPLYNTLATPRGGQYQLDLPDGTKVWLNAASSITYPTAITAGRRDVTITGEAYFEVSKKVSQPFTVRVNNRLTVEVLGTSFDCNAYPDEPRVTTTLLEGAVRVSMAKATAANGEGSTVLRPGEQAQLPTDSTSRKDQLHVSKGVNLDEALAWKVGYFHFESADLPTILRQFSRWYGVDVEYKGAVPTDRYFTIVRRSSSLATVLKALQAGGVHFTLTGRKLIVQKE
jgi:transmembrane sensor